MQLNEPPVTNDKIIRSNMYAYTCEDQLKKKKSHLCVLCFVVIIKSEKCKKCKVEQVEYPNQLLGSTLELQEIQVRTLILRAQDVQPCLFHFFKGARVCLCKLIV